MLANEPERDIVAHRDIAISRLLLGVLFAGIVLDLLILITAPDNTISTSGIPKGVDLKTNGSWLFAPTAAPTPAHPTPVAPAAVLPAATPVSTLAARSSPTATPAPAGIIPQRMWIPGIGVDANVEKVGRLPNGFMDVPKNLWNVAWFEPGTRPGAKGSAVIAGHLDGPNTAAVFWDLKKLRFGQRIQVADAVGHVLTFEVYETAIYPYDKAPLDRIFDNNDGIYLNLITCNGSFDFQTQNYNNRLVVYTRLVNLT